MSWNATPCSNATKQSPGRRRKSPWVMVALLAPLTLVVMGNQKPKTVATDPGVRGGLSASGSPIANLTPGQLSYFSAGLANFAEVDSVQGSITGTGRGLGPRFNAESCAQCHAAPAIGGSSPSVNPQIAIATDQGAANQIPNFLSASGPVREVRFPFMSDLKTPDGGVHDLFTITGRNDATGCNLTQPDFQTAAQTGNLIFRIPTPTYGDGLIESIPDATILANMAASAAAKLSLGIAGHPNNRTHAAIGGQPNTSGNDGTITRFGWKAQNKSVAVFAGEAYNVEMGVTNELFPNERDDTPGCQFNPTPEDATNFDLTGPDIPSDVVRFSLFMRFLDQPQPAPATASTTHGQQVFAAIGCTLCHTPTLTTGQSSVAALSNVPANLYSDLLVHHMGPQLADNVAQGEAAGDEFRTAPLWGLGQRIFFLHDGRTTDLVQVIQGHQGNRNRTYQGSEANTVIQNYKNLSAQDQQDLLNFLRSL
jgi:CxxC motif-containing protein (DUF1111 family)